MNELNSPEREDERVARRDRIARRGGRGRDVNAPVPSSSRLSAPSSPVARRRIDEEGGGRQNSVGSERAPREDGTTGRRRRFGERRRVGRGRAFLMRSSSETSIFVAAPMVNSMAPSPASDIVVERVRRGRARRARGMRTSSSGFLVGPGAEKLAVQT
eukprot:31088-Pelagococcus_subviridis.AAC.5